MDEKRITIADLKLGWINEQRMGRAVAFDMDERRVRPLADLLDARPGESHQAFLHICQDNIRERIKRKLIEGRL